LVIITDSILNIFKKQLEHEEKEGQYYRISTI